MLDGQIAVGRFNIVVDVLAVVASKVWKIVYEEVNWCWWRRVVVKHF